MEPENGRNGDNNKGEEPVDGKAAEQTPATSTAVTPRRGLRERGPVRQKPGVPASSPDINGAAASTQGSGRVLRDRSTRAVPAWLKESKSDEEEEVSPDTGATKRKKVAHSRRKKNIEIAGSTDNAAEVAGDSVQAKE